MIGKKILADTGKQPGFEGPVYGAFNHRTLVKLKIHSDSQLTDEWEIRLKNPDNSVAQVKLYHVEDVVAVMCGRFQTIWVARFRNPDKSPSDVSFVVEYEI